MKTKIVGCFFIVSGLISCSNQAGDEKVQTAEIVVAPNPDSARFTILGSQDSTITNGESIVKYPNGNVKMAGMMKNGQRDGLWKSYYENGLPWSETTFSNGIRNGKTSTWYENGKKRYDGFYTNDVESGTWTYWDEKGGVATTKDFGKK